MNQKKNGGEVTPEMLIQHWVDKLEGLGFTDLVLFSGGWGIWARRGPISANVELTMNDSARVTLIIQMYNKCNSPCNAALRVTFDDSLSDLTETLEVLEASIPTAKEEIAKLLAEVKG